MEYEISLGKDFKSMVSGNRKLFVDKSEFIEEIINSGAQAILITRPRRFGKSTNLDMAKTFFEPELDKHGKAKLAKYRENKKLFERLKIGTGGYVDTNEIVSRMILLLKDGTLVGDVGSTRKYCEIAKSINFPNKEYVLRSYEVDEEASNQLETQVKRYVLTLKEKFSEVESLNMLIDEYHKAKNISESKLEEQGLIRKMDEKFDSLIEAIKAKLEEWKGNDRVKYENIKAEFDLIGMNQGRCPVIYISFKDISGDTSAAVESNLKNLITDLYKSYKYLMYSSELDSDDKANFQKYIDQDYQGTVTINQSIKFLSSLLYKHYDEKVYIFIDEYDRPINYFLAKSFIKNSGVKKEVSKLLTNIMSACGKENAYLNKIVLTGILDAFTKEIGSGFNNLKVYRIKDVKFSRSFGFSEEEVNELINKLWSGGEIVKKVSTDIKEWYNGYTVPISESTSIGVYTSWAVMSYLEAAYYENIFKPKSYWSETGVTDILQSLLTKESCINSTLSRKLLSIVEVGGVSLISDDSISLFKYDLSTAPIDERIFSYLFLDTGYLTMDPTNKSNFFRIPNFEVRTEFVGILKTHANNHANSNVCDKILEKLQKKQRTKAITLIQEGEADVLNEVLVKENVACQDPEMRFNYFHIAAMFGNSDVYAVLMKYCDQELRTARDQYGLKPYDYNNMLNNSIEPTFFQNESLSIKLPTGFERFMCHPYPYMFGYTYSDFGSYVLPIVAVLACAYGSERFLARNNRIRLLLESMKADRRIQILVPFFPPVLNNLNWQQYVFPLCESYKEYNKINILQYNFTSPEMFAKYKLDHKTTSVVLNSSCGKEEKLLERSFDVFNNAFYGDTEITFTLCGSTQNDNHAMEIQVADIVAVGIPIVATLALLWQFRAAYISSEAEVQAQLQAQAQAQHDALLGIDADLYEVD
jgi:hypothetical protein